MSTTNTTDPSTNAAAGSTGRSLVALITTISASLIVFGIQTGLFLLLRLKLARIFKPKTYLAPERERTDPPPNSPWGMINALLRFRDREIMNKCGLDSYFFLRYLQTLLIIFIPIALVLIPILVPINYIGGISNDFSSNGTNGTTKNNDRTNITGLDTLAWGNIAPNKVNRYWAHLILAVLVVLWVCGVFFAELRVFVKVRQDWLTTAEHRLRASATTVLVSAIPDKWLSEEALRGLFDVFPGGIRNIWLTRDLQPLLDKTKKRDEIHKQLEGAETELIRAAKRKQLKKREADEKEARKQSRSKAPTKEQKAQRQQDEDAAAKIQAESGAGASSGDQHEVPHDVRDGVREAKDVHDERGEDQNGRGAHQGRQARDEGGLMSVPILGTGLSKLTQGIGKGAGVVGKTGQGILGGAKNVAGQLDNQVETTNGFVTIPASAPRSSTPPNQQREGRHVRLPNEEEMARPSTSGSERKMGGHIPTHSSAATRLTHSAAGSYASQDDAARKEGIELKSFRNTTRKASNLEDMYINDKARWFQFWKAPAGGFASPIPQGAEGSEFPFKQKTFGEKFKAAIPFLADKEEPREYPKAHNDEFDEDGEGKAEWEKWLKKSDRPTHRLARFEWTPGFLPGLPFLNQKVDTIYWCRKELARLNLEIEEDQQHPERYPLMKSAFIQFNHQVAAHMACQSVIHHVPRHMAPRTVEISPDDVLWENMAISWWSEWLRTGAVWALVAGMIILWALPVSFTSSLSQIDSLIQTYQWLGFLKQNDLVYKVVQALSGVLPAILLAVLLLLVPIIMDLLAGFKGAKTGSQKAESVQVFYFAFLLVQVFFVVSLASSITSVLAKLAENPASIAGVLASSLPKAANYFFSYMILQALSTSSGTLLQIGALVSWYIIAKITNNTARNKWTTNTTLPRVKWGSYFPVYTNFACIALIYSIVAPIISIFAIITFSLLWIANRYTMLYVNRLSIDTGGVLYPRAINQTFAGLYIMELCLIGLFFLITDADGNLACTAQAIIMVVVTILTVLYQFLLNYSFGPLFRYLPITFEDEAVIRDEAFQRAQDRRLGLIDDDDDEVFEKEGLPSHHHRHSGPSNTVDGAGDKHRRGNKFTNFKPVKGLAHAGSLAMRGGKTIRDQTYGRAEKGMKNATEYRNQRREKDLEAQRAIGEALFGGYHDEIEDLTPEERDVLVQRAFMHEALRARRPTVWIPRDDLGVSDDEIRRTQQLSDHIWISNEGTALDSKVRVVYGRAPPDFSELDLINL